MGQLVRIPALEKYSSLVYTPWFQVALRTVLHEDFEPLPDFSLVKPSVELEVLDISRRKCLWGQRQADFVFDAHFLYMDHL